MQTALVVGAGFAGCVASERLAAAGWSVTLIDKRKHIGGNAYDQQDEWGNLIHPYGPHIFHTNDPGVFEYLSRFTDWRFYEHRVRAYVDGKMYPVPVNRNTLEMVFGVELKNEQAAFDLLSKLQVPCSNPKNSEDVVLSRVGKRLTDLIFAGYTKKQWDKELHELSPSVLSRIPVRLSTNDHYFEDRFQFMPNEGFTKMFEQMTRHPNIKVELGVDVRERVWRVDHTVYTGPVDEYFNYCHGKLPYRSLRFEHWLAPGSGLVQPVAVLNFPDPSIPYTRVTEFNHLTGFRNPFGSSLCREYSQADGDPYYPVPTEASAELHRKYREMADKLTDVTFVGRLAQYRYYNMDQVVAAALTAAKRITG